MISVFERISDEWFITEPLLFSVLCTHSLVENNQLNILMRSGKKRIEYNSNKLKELSNIDVEEYLKIEIIRIILKHPYQRQPYNPEKEILTTSSNLVIAETYTPKINMPKATDFNLPSSYSFEEYYNSLLILFKNQFNSPNSKRTSSSNNKSLNENKDLKKEEKVSPTDGLNNKLSNRNEFNEDIDNLKESSQLWEEDQVIQDNVNQLITNAETNKTWGTLSGNLIGIIKASLIVEINYRQILKSFRASVLSSERKLTRMRPSRRYGFNAMGSQKKFATKLLLAVDVSGSVCNKSLQIFFSIINRFFKYGIKSIDVIQFDYDIKGEVTTLKKAKGNIQIKGRGGTNFQSVFNYVCENNTYDGLIIFTDGYAPAPVLKKTIKAKILWMLENKEQYNQHKNWTNKIPKSKAAWIDYSG